MPSIRSLDASVIRSISECLGATDSGLTNRQITELLNQAGIQDVTPIPASPYVYYAVAKRDHLYNCLVARQNHDAAANGILPFLECVMSPVRFMQSPGQFASWRATLNQSLAFAGLHISEEGRIGLRAETARTLSRRVMAMSLVEQRWIVLRHIFPYRPSSRQVSSARFQARRSSSCHKAATA